MTKRVNWQPNLRVDLPDMQAGTDGFSSAEFQQVLNRLITGNLARIAAGFRVEIADQIATPGQFTVYNGVAFDRSGQIVNNEIDVVSARSLTLTVAGFYYIEVDFVTTPSDTDARGFWDPTADNGVEPSGDPLPTGREVQQNVSTRLTPDWNIVQPVSTTGFDLAANPNSTKIPVAIIHVAGGVISGGSTAANTTVLRETALPGDIVLRVVDSRLMPDAFTLNLTGNSGLEVLTVTANDRENGVLTLSAATANGGAIGARAAVAGATPKQFLVERLNGLDGFPTVAATSDARLRMWQGDEERGYAYGQDPAAAAPARGDIQIQTLKSQIDFLAAQLREVRFGAQRAADMGALAPPVAFSAVPRYFEFAGGLQGARTNTVSVGDGVASWGDFNVTSFANAGACIQAAHDALPTSGGTIYIKRSPNPYLVPTGAAILLSKPVRMVGDGPAATEIRASGTSQPVQLTTAVDFAIEEMTISQTNGQNAGAALSVSSPASLYLKRLVIHGLSVAGTLARGLFEEVTFAPPNGQGRCVNGVVQHTAFIQCIFTHVTDNEHALVLTGASQFVDFRYCQFARNGAGSFANVSLSASSSYIKFDHCQIAGSSVTTQGVLAAAGASFIDLNECSSPVAGLFFGDGVSDCTFRRCDLNLLGTVYGIRIGPTTPSTRIHVLGCSFTESSPAPTPISLENCTESTVLDCTFLSVHFGVNLSNSSDIVVANCKFTNPGNAVPAALAINASDANPVSRLVVANCIFNAVGVSITITNTLSYAAFIGCHMVGVEGSGLGASGFFITPNKIKSLVVAECTFVGTSSTQVGPRIQSLTTAGNSIIGLKFVNNRIESFKAVGSVMLVKGYSMYGIEIDDNTFYDIGNTGGASTVTAVLEVDGFEFGGLHVTQNIMTNIANTVTDAVVAPCLLFGPHIAATAGGNWFGVEVAMNVLGDSVLPGNCVPFTMNMWGLLNDLIYSHNISVTRYQTGVSTATPGNADWQVQLVSNSTHKNIAIRANNHTIVNNTAGTVLRDSIQVWRGSPVGTDRLYNMDVTDNIFRMTAQGYNGGININMPVATIAVSNFFLKHNTASLDTQNPASPDINGFHVDTNGGALTIRSLPAYPSAGNPYLDNFSLKAV